VTAVGFIVIIGAPLVGVWLGLRRAIIRLVLDEEIAVNNIHPDDYWPGWSE
jgi:hypothetical protein